MKPYLAAMALLILPAVAMAQSTDSTRGQPQSQAVSQDTTTSRGDVASDSTHKGTGYDKSNPSDSAKAKNQNQSGVTNSTTGTSTLGKKVTKTTPTQGEPVTAKGDTLTKGKKDSTSGTPPRH